MAKPNSKRKSNAKEDIRLDPVLDSGFESEIDEAWVRQLIVQVAEQAESDSGPESDRLTAKQILDQNDLGYVDPQYAWPAQFKDDEEAEQLPERIGYFRQITPIRRGRHAYLCRGFDETWGRPVALKIARRDEAGNPFSLKSEIHAYRKISDERFGRLQKVVQYENHELLVLDWIEGWSLRELLENRAFQPEEVAAIACEVVRGLESIAESGLVHRDIKPSNLMLTHRGTIKIVDLGTAFLATGDQPAESPSQIACGTPGYIAPEQLRNASNADFRSDFYSLGVTMIEMLSGRRPQSDSWEENETPKRLSQLPIEEDPLRFLPETTPGGLQDLISRLTRDAPEQRIATFQELIATLKTLAGPIELRDIAKEFADESLESKQTHSKNQTGETASGKSRLFSRLFLISIAVVALLLGAILLLIQERFRPAAHSTAAGFDAERIQQDLQGIWPVETALIGDEALQQPLQIGFCDTRMFVLDRGRTVFIGSFFCVSAESGTAKLNVKHRGTLLHPPHLMALVKLEAGRLKMTVSEFVSVEVSEPAPRSNSLTVTTKPVIPWSNLNGKLPESLNQLRVVPEDRQRVEVELRLLQTDPKLSIRKRNHHLRDGLSPPPPFDAISL